jgi:recombination protein RecT
MANELAKSGDKAGSLVQKLGESFQAALPNHVTKEHFGRALLTEFRRTPKLMNCDGKSVASAVMTCAQLGLMIGVNGAAYLIPFKEECTLVIGYQGLVDLCYRSGHVESVVADVVCENDEFEYCQGLEQRLHHVPNLKGDRGEAYAAYAIARIKDSKTPVFVVMNNAELEAVKNASPGARSRQSPWNGPFVNEMRKKTALRRLCKILPKSVELSTAMEFENRQAERIQEVEATVMAEDPLSPGRHSTRKAKEAPQEAPDAPEGCEAYEDLRKLYTREAGAVLTVLGPLGCGEWSDLDPQDSKTASSALAALKS